jgi:hypothetical protein
MLDAIAPFVHSFFLWVALLAQVGPLGCTHTVQLGGSKRAKQQEATTYAVRHTSRKLMPPILACRHTTTLVLPYTIHPQPTCLPC